MKKLFSVLIAAVAITVASLSTSSCDKLSRSLAGTTWTARQTFDEVVNFTLTFAKTEFTLNASGVNKSGNYTFTFFGTYTYDDPIVTLTIDEDGLKDTMHGIRDKYTISFEPDGPIFAWKK